MTRTSFVLLVPFLMLLCTMSAAGEEIPLETCDRLPVVQVRVSGSKYLFLVDTAATSILNSRSFPIGDPSTVTVTSWSGTVNIIGHEVMLADLEVGHYHLKNLKLRAVDLSPIGRACGRVISGILGIDLLTELHVSVDFKDHVARLLENSDASDTPANLQNRVKELEKQLGACEEAFNRADAESFSACLDPNVVIFTLSGDYYGREAAMQYYRSHYFEQSPRPQLTLTPLAHHALGEAIWLEYDLRIVTGEQVVLAHGTALCQKENGRWRIVHMNHSRK